MSAPCATPTCRARRPRVTRSPGAEPALAAMAVLPAPERVLPTLNADGTRRRVRPKLYRGRIHSARRIVGWSLLALFVALPLFRLNHKPLILLDVQGREFTLFGRTF